MLIRKFESSRDLAVSTVKLLEQTILETEWKNARYGLTLKKCEADRPTYVESAATVSVVYPLLLLIWKFLPQRIDGQNRRYGEKIIGKCSV